MKNITPDDLRKAYEEGFDDGQDRGRSPHVSPPMCIAWLESSARFGFFRRMTEEEATLVNRFHDSFASECEDEQRWIKEVDKLPEGGAE